MSTFRSYYRRAASNWRSSNPGLLQLFQPHQVIAGMPFHNIEPSTVSATNKVSNHNPEKILLERHIDPDYGLLDKLLGNGTLSYDEYTAIRDKGTRLDKNQELLKIVIMKNRYDQLLDTLKEDGQSHVTNYGSNQRHIFISYQWDSKKPMIEKLVNSLKTEGFEVWVDLDNVSETKLNATARAVEEAAVVLVCLSEKYKESPNCRTEAEYASRLGKGIIPLQLQSHYQPDGWLEDLVGDRRMHDFTSDEKYSESIKILMEELGVKTTEYEGGDI